MSRITVVGAGYVGLTTAACLADLGNHVHCLDIDAGKVGRLRQGELPFFEPGLAEVVDRTARAGRLDFCTDYAQAIPGSEYVFLAVATPSGEAGEADVGAIEAAAGAVAEAMTGELVLVNKSTVPVGTADLVERTVAGRNGRYPVFVASNPEFLREGSALADFMRPDRIVIGAHEPAVAARVAKLYEALRAPTLITSVHAAEMIKYASNAFLATKISFVNEVARICERLEADVRVVATGMALDRRIGPHYLEAGLGYGGSCLPKDVAALAATAKAYGHHPELLEAVMEINQDQRRLAVTKVEEALDGLRGRVVGLLGLAFKPDTDDLRQAPSLDIARGLVDGGATVRAYDPVAVPAALRAVPEIRPMADPYQLADCADALVVVTEWNEFRHLDLARLKELMRTPVVVDGRNLYDPDQMRALGFTYRGFGRN